MTFNPVVPIGGYAGWTFLNRTMAKRRADERFFQSWFFEKGFQSYQIFYGH